MITAQDLRDWLKMPATANTDDAILDTCVASAISKVREHCGRTFEATTTATRVFPVISTRVFVDDAQAIAMVEVSNDQASWTNVGSWQQTQSRSRITSIEITEGALWCRVTATFGWDAPPADVVTAALLTAARIYKRKDSPFGVESFADFGVRIARVDPDVAEQLQPWRRFDVIGGVA